MAARRMGCVVVVLLSLLSLFGDTYGTEFVPVFMWGSVKPLTETATPALKKYSTDDFADFFQKKLSAYGENQPVVLAFTEENLSVEDFSWQDQAENTVFQHLQKVSSSAPDASFIHSVEKPMKVLNKLKGFERIVTQDSDAIHIPKKGGVLVVLEMKDARGDEDRPDLLRRHDTEISEVYTRVLKEAGDRGVIAVYTGYHCSWTEPESEPVRFRNRRLLAEPATTNSTAVLMNATGILIYAKESPVVSVSGKIILLEHLISATADTRTGYQSLLAKFSTNDTNQASLKFWFYNTTSTYGYWSLENVTYMDIGSSSDVETVLYPEHSIIVPITFSYHCSSETIFRAVGSNMTIKFVNFQAQPYLPEKEVPVFGDAYNCELFFTAPILSGLFVTLILALIMIWGLAMIMDIRTMDQFDDPKGKTITISATE